MSKPDSLSFGDTLHVRDHCLCLHAQRAARSLARHFDRAFKPLGLTNGQFSLLMSLNRPVPARMGDVAALLAMDRTTLTALLKPLQRSGLCTIEIDAADRRGRRLTLTDAGREILAQALPIWIRDHREIEAKLDDADALRRGLIAIA